MSELHSSKMNNRDGIGLGLILTQSIIRLNNGSISIKSIMDEGTKVKINLPKRDLGN